MAQGASGRPSPLLTPALQLGLWSLRWLAWLGSRAAEGHRSCQGQPRPPAAPSRLGWEPQRSEHTEQVGDAGRPSGTASRPFLSFPNTWEEREPWDGVSPVRLSPQSSRGPAGRADHPQERGRGHLWASPTTNCQTGARAPCPTGAREGLSTQCPRGPSTSTRDNTPGAHTAAAGSRGTFGQELWGLRCWGALAALGRGWRILLGPHPEASSLDPLPGPASEAPVAAEGGVCLPPPPQWLCQMGRKGRERAHPG